MKIRISFGLLSFCTKNVRSFHAETQRQESSYFTLRIRIVPFLFCTFSFCPPPPTHPNRMKTKTKFPVFFFSFVVVADADFCCGMDTPAMAKNVSGWLPGRAQNRGAFFITKFQNSFIHSNNIVCFVCLLTFVKRLRFIFHLNPFDH